MGGGGCREGSRSDPGADADDSLALTEGVRGVGDEVHDHLLDLGPVRFDGGEALSQLRGRAAFFEMETWRSGPVRPRSVEVWA